MAQTFQYHCNDVISRKNVAIVIQAIEDKIDDPTHQQILKMFISNFSILAIAHNVNLSSEEVILIIERKDHYLERHHHLGFSLKALRRLCLN